ncbi:hypothetical protein M9H77_34309 [Catharanthus roseus]|uniref:Uncharacterized protein n=1 Tax=Catharanthus roseus TaxID=4058 RepID=A0ACB9ZKV2_CATRO|nr:hypothetical protein M9H77_34309 [Catharanthus roseus]
MHKRSLEGNLQRSKISLKTTRFYEDEVIKLKTLKTRRMVMDSFIRASKLSNNEDENDEDEDMALVIRKFKKFYKKGFNKREKKPPFNKGGQSSSLFKTRSDCPKAIEKEKVALEAKLEAIKKKKKTQVRVKEKKKLTCASWH